MANHLVIDIETLSTELNAVILSVACVYFSLQEYQTFDQIKNTGIMIKFDVNEQIRTFKRSVTQETMKWWKKQDQATFDSIVKPSDKDVAAKYGLTIFNKYISSVPSYIKNESYVWSKGNNFDFPILYTLYKDVNLVPAYNEKRVRDIRTAVDILAGTSNYDLVAEHSSFIPHNPLHDAAMDAARINELFHRSL